MEKGIVRKVLEGIKERKDKITIMEELGINDTLFSAIIHSLIREGYLVEVRCDKKCKMCPLACYKQGDAKIYVISEDGMRFLDGN